MPLVIAFALYLIPLTIIVYRTHWAKSTEEFNVANRILPTTLIFASVSATFIGPGFSMGFIGKGYEYGLFYCIFGIFYAFQTILVGIFVTPRLRLAKSASTLGGVYGNKAGNISQIIVGILSVGLCAGFSAVMLKAGGTLFQNFFHWPLWLGVILTGFVTTIYTVSGGLKASVATDAFQFIIFSILIPILLIVLFITGKFDIPSSIKISNNLSSHFLSNTSVLGIIALIVSFLFGETMIPPYASRALASKSSKTSRKGFVNAGIFGIFWFLVVIIIGIAARQSILDGTKEDQVLLELIKQFPSVIQYFMGIALIGVVMSSLDSLLNSGGVAFSEDLFKKFFPRISDKGILLSSRIGIIFILVIGCIAALKIETIIGGLLKCYSMWAPAIIPSLIYMLFIKNFRKIAVIISLILGVVVPLLMEFKIINTSIDTIIVGLGITILSIIVVHFGGRLWKLFLS